MPREIKVITLEKCAVCGIIQKNCKKSFGAWFCPVCYKWHDSLVMLQKISRYERQAEVAQK